MHSVDNRKGNENIPQVAQVCDATAYCQSSEHTQRIDNRFSRNDSTGYNCCHEQL